MGDREGFLKRLEERLSRMSGWLAERRSGQEQAHAPDLHGRMEGLRRETARLRQAVTRTTRMDLDRVRATLEDMKTDYDVPPQHTSLRREEREAFRRHLHTTAHLVRDLASADSPGYDRAEEEYERSWEELRRAFEADEHAPHP
jgi:hypothetical protein